MPDEPIVRPTPPTLRGSEPPRAGQVPPSRPMKATERLTANDVLQTLQARVATLEVENARHVRERAEESDFSGKMLATLSEREEQTRKLRARLEEAERALDHERIAAATRRTELEDALAVADRRAQEAIAALAKREAEVGAREEASLETIAKLERQLREANAKAAAASAEQEGAKLAALLASSGAERARALLGEAQRLDGDLFTLRSRAYGAAEDMLRRLLEAAPQPSVQATKAAESTAKPKPDRAVVAPPSTRGRDALPPRPAAASSGRDGGTPTLVLDPSPSLPISQRQVLPTAANSTDGMVALRSLPPEEDDGPELLIGGASDDVDADLNDAFDAALSKRRDAE